MPLGTFLGAPTVERHKHYDANGRLTGTTVVKIESPWDDDSREAAYALHQDDLERCPQCKGPRDECADPGKDWFPQQHICWKTAAEQVLRRRWNEKHEDAEPDAVGYLPTDGVALWVSLDDLTPDDDFV